MTNLDVAGGSALSRCIACGVDVFSERHWGQAPLLTRAADLAGGFADLLDAPGVDELVSARGLRTPFLRMAKDGDVLAAARFTRGGGSGATINDQAADDKVLALIADGATLVLQGLHRTWPPLVDFTARLSDELGHPVQVNAYITPPQNRGFAPHYDVHDVFVLQVSGRKHWTIHEPVFVDPLARHNWEQRRDAVAARAEEPPLIDTVLEPGDALYLPRGTIHSAKALGETSIHLTVGIHALTRTDLVRHIVDASQETAALRGSLPMGVDLSNPDALAPHLVETVSALRDYLDDVDAVAVAARVGTSLRSSTRPEAIGPLAQLAAADQLTADTSLRLRIGARASVEVSADEVVIVVLDRRVSVPLAAAEAVKMILSGSPFTAAQLPGLEADEQLVVARRLLREGLLVPA